MHTLFGFPRAGPAAIESALARCGVAHRIVDAASREPSAGLDALRAVAFTRHGFPPLKLPPSAPTSKE